MRGMRFNDSSDAPGLIAGTAPVRQPGRGEMLIRVHTAGVTPTECIRLPTHPRRRKENRSDSGHDQMGREVFGMNNWFAGVFVFQLARRAEAHVITTASARNFDFLLQLGANELIDYCSVRFEDRARDSDVVFAI